MGAPTITDSLAVQVLAKMLDDSLATIDRRDLTICRLLAELDQTHAANVDLHREKARLVREVTLLRAELAEERGRAL